MSCSQIVQSMAGADDVQPKMCRPELQVQRHTYRVKNEHGILRDTTKANIDRGTNHVSMHSRFNHSWQGSRHKILEVVIDRTYKQRSSRIWGKSTRTLNPATPSQHRPHQRIVRQTLANDLHAIAYGASIEEKVLNDRQNGQGSNGAGREELSTGECPWSRFAICVLHLPLSMPSTPPVRPCMVMRSRRPRRLSL